MLSPVRTTVHKLAPAVLVSLIATSLGLLSLYRSEVPMIQDFGKMLTIGIVIAFLFALLVLLPILYLNTKLGGNKPSKNNQENSKYDAYAYKVAAWIQKGRYIILFVAVALAGVGFYFDQEVGVETDMETFMPQDSQALADIQELRDLVGSTDRIAILYEAEEVASYETIKEVESLIGTIEENLQESIVTMNAVPLILDSVSNEKWTEDNYEEYLSDIPEDQLKLLQSSSEGLGVIQISLEDMNPDEFEIFTVTLEELLLEYDSLQVTLTGQSVVDDYMLRSMTDGRLEMTLVGILLVFAALLLIYRNIFKALIPILPIVVIVGWSGGIMYLLEYDYTPLTSTLGALIIGIGTEFTILIMMRFYEEKEKNNSTLESIKIALSKMSRPIIISAVTTMGGFSALILSDFEILSNFGIMTLINIGLALLSALLVLPAFLAVIGSQSKVLS